VETLQQKPSQIELEENSTSWTFYGSQSKSLIVLVSRFWPGQIWSPKKFLNLPKWQWVPFQKKVSPYNTSWSNMATGSKMLAGMVEGVALLQWSTGAEKNTWQQDLLLKTNWIFFTRHCRLHPVINSLGWHQRRSHLQFLHLTKTRSDHKKLTFLCFFFHYMIVVGWTSKYPSVLSNMASWGGFCREDQLLPTYILSWKKNIFSGLPATKSYNSHGQFSRWYLSYTGIPMTIPSKKRDTRHFSTTVQFTMFWYAYPLVN
jgi:hypothetical protein